MVKAKEHYQQFLERARTTVSHPAALFTIQPPRKVPAAEIYDVLYDQLDFLIDHIPSAGCNPNCKGCERLQHVVYWLTLPFFEKSDSE